MAFFAAALPVIGTAVTVGAQIMQGMAQADAYEANADAVRAAGKFEKYKLRRAQEQMTSKQRALYAKSGVSMEGSPLEVMADSYAQYELDIAVNKYNTESEAKRLEAAAGASRTTGFLKAGGTLLTAASGMSFGGGGTKAQTATQKTGVDLSGGTWV